MTSEKLTEILKELSAGLAQQLGERLEALYLYGSQARGDAHPDSDIDVLIVVRGDFDYSRLLEMTSDLIWKLSLDNDVLISRVFVSKESFQHAGSPFLMNVQREAVLL